MWELDHEEGWALKNWCFQTVVLEKTLESHLDSKEINPVNPKGNQPWIFIGRTDPEAPISTWCKELTHWERPWCWKRLRAGGEGGTEDQMVEWHHWFYGHEFEQFSGIGEGQGSLACCSPWSWEDLVGQSNWTLADTTAILKMNSQIFPCILFESGYSEKYNWKPDEVW